MPQPSPSLRESTAGPVMPLTCLAVLLAITAPQFLRTPLTNDTALYDLQSRMLRDGAVLYRDVLEPNLPGVVWIHLGVRQLFGSSSEAIRIFDLVVLMIILTVAAVLVRTMSRPSSATAWFALAGTGFYLSMSEWCHTQRDTWMLAPALLGLLMRYRHVQQRSTDDFRSPARCYPAISRFLEGLIWGAAVWIKPHVVIPALAVWIAGCFVIRSWRGIFQETTPLLAGGLVAGALGVGWICHSGSWPFFWETLREWNPGYFEAGRRNWTATRFAAMTFRLWPWFALHLLAVPLAIRMCCGERAACICERDCEQRKPLSVMLAVFYLGWLAQALLVQHLFDYVHVPAIMLAVLLLILHTTDNAGMTAAWRLAWAGFALMAAMASPILRSDRLGAWKHCITGPVTPRLQDRLSYFDNPRHEDLQRVAEFLRREGATGQDVCFFNSDFISLYCKLGLNPPTRFVYLQELLVYFPDRRPEMWQAVSASDHRFVVTDLIGCGMSREQAEQAGRLGPPPSFPVTSAAYPWSCPVVYRSGTYLVHRVDGTGCTTIEPLLRPVSSATVTGVSTDHGDERRAGSPPIGG